jgi:hypothetical protein
MLAIRFLERNLVSNETKRALEHVSIAWDHAVEQTML